MSQKIEIPNEQIENGDGDDRDDDGKESGLCKIKTIDVRKRDSQQI